MARKTSKPVKKKIPAKQKKEFTDKAFEGYGVSEEYAKEVVSLIEDGEVEMAGELTFWAFESEEKEGQLNEIDENYPHDFGETGEVQMSVRVRRIKESQSGD